MSTPAKEKTWWSRPWAIVVWLVAFAAGGLAFVNGIPQFVDETLPWLGERIRIGEIDATVWDLASVVAAVAGAASALATFRANRRIRAIPEDYPLTYDGQLVNRTPAEKHHTLAAVGGTTITCSCGWRGPGWEFKEHQKGR